jgi:ribosomal protein S18 acetylase RimI-like enzyme
MNTDIAMLHRLEGSLKNAAAKSREKVLHDYFDAFISSSPEPHLSFASPKTGLENLAAIASLKETFRERERVARLEYFHELYPDLKKCLLESGFELDMSAPVMTLVPEALAESLEMKASYKVLAADEGMFETFLRAQNISFGGTGEDSLVWLSPMMDMLGQGELMGAVLEQDGKAVSGAVIQGAEDGELAGVWTLPAYRRQGLSFALCQRLLKDYFTKDQASKNQTPKNQTLCWLSAAEGALGLYEKLGFKRVGTQLNVQLS